MLHYLQGLLSALDLTSLLDAVLRVAAIFLCLTVHETCHGLAALALGDPTAKSMHRLSLNPLRHIDWIGLLMMFVAGFGWAKPVPVDMRHFRHPKSGMAITALAGPLSNFLMGWAALGGASLLYHFALKQIITVQLYAHLFALLIQIAVLSVGLGMFNLIPFPPLDGSKILFSLLPDRIYYFILRYERYLMAALFALVFFGLLDTPLDVLRNWGLKGLCQLTRFPADFFGL